MLETLILTTYHTEEMGALGDVENYMTQNGYNYYKYITDGSFDKWNFNLTRKMVIDFIEEIVVDNEKNIKIRFKFEDELKNISSIFDKKTVK